MSNLSRFRKVCPAAGTFSKDPRAFWGDDSTAHPQFLAFGEGAYVTAESGGKYLDRICALGANLLGYGNQEWIQSVMQWTVRGASFSLPTMLECEVAEFLINILGKHVSGWSSDDLQVRFFKTGSECTTAAVRLARAVAGRDLILRCKDSYLGWGDTFIATIPPAHGIPYSYREDTILFKYGQDIKEISDEVAANYNPGKSMFAIPQSEFFPACVVLEQGLYNPPEDWYVSLRKWCDDNNVLLILDETASGFRYGLGGAAERFNIQPDLACYGKALGNGVAIAALVGRKEYMEWFGRKDPVFCSGTFCGETLGLAGAKATLEIITREPVMEHLAIIGGALRVGLTDAFKDTPVKVIGHDVRHILQWPDDQWHAYVVREMAKRGILLNRPNYSTYAHTIEDARKTITAAQEIVDNWKKNGLPEYSESCLPRVLFRNR